MALIKTEFKGINDLMQKIEFLEKRLNHFETIFLIKASMEKKNLTLVERLTAPTSKFFRIIRNIGLCLAAVGGSIMASPVTLPSIIVTIAGYIVVAGGVMTAVAQATVEGE
ncbi:MAG TPA: hypothetical protein VIH57_22905 [Bacteroidales bacterium]